MPTSDTQKSVTLSQVESRSRSTPTPMTQQPLARTNQPNSLKPSRDGPIMACAANLRRLKASSRQIYRELRDCRASFSRLTIPHQSTFEAEWVTFVDQYKNLLDDADLSASQLIAVIKVYLVLQSSKNEAPEADMITELGNLQQTLANRTYDLCRRCEKIGEDVQASHDRLSEAVEMSRTTLAHFENGKNANSTGGNVDTSARVSTNKPSSRPAGSISTYFWELVSAFLALISPESDCRKEPRQETKKGASDPRRTQGRRQDSNESTKRFPNTNPRQNTQSSQLSQSSATSGTLSAIKEVITGLETQAPLFDAFTELAQHLRNEVEAYLRAFEAAKAYPASVRLFISYDPRDVLIRYTHTLEKEGA
ncbi:hypothetical protein GY45DRAFT_1365101 [Cubamyces sp. BRFM 1775]|nr:hypothetical protein GY45DRAFT_1365101 [Cubamyces sp. BRFM 1775]